MSNEKTFWDSVYEMDETGKTQTLYDNWAHAYDAEVMGNGYASPKRCADALKQFADTDDIILDLGCGTGLSGEAFADAGFKTIDGTDFSEEMLDVAREKGVYRTLLVGDLSDPIPVEPGSYKHIAAVGVFSPGHAPAGMMDDVLKLLPAGGTFTFTLNDHALEEGVYEKRLFGLRDAGKLKIIFDEYGDHLPGKDLKSKVYAVEALSPTV